MNSNLPSMSKQKKFIIENSHILNKTIRINIFSIVMMELEDHKDIIISENMGNVGININLDIIEELKPNVITHIYNIIKNRLDTLSKPVKYLN
jgi:hypothetical protein